MAHQGALPVNGLNRITNIAAQINNTDSISKIYMSTYSNSFIDKILIETLIWEYNQSAPAIYKFNRGNSSEVSMSSTRQVDRIYCNDIMFRSSPQLLVPFLGQIELLRCERS